MGASAGDSSPLLLEGAGGAGVRPTSPERDLPRAFTRMAHRQRAIQDMDIP